MKTAEEKAKAKQERVEKEAKVEKARKIMEEVNIKTIEDVDDFMSGMLESLLQAMMDAEFESHMGYEKNKQKSKDKNYRNGYSSKSKTVRSKYGKMQIDTPRDRNNEFEPVIIPKRTRVMEGLEDAIISMTAKGLSLTDIKGMIKDIYKVELSNEKISLLTQRVNEELEQWRNRKLESIYAMVYVDCMYVKIKEEYKSRKRPVYVVIGINMEGKKEVLGFYIGDSENETITYWRTVFEDIKARGVRDILHATFDGLIGFEEAINETFKETKTQRCIVHIGRNLYKKSPKSKRKEVMRDFKEIYTSSLIEYAQEGYKKFLEKYKEEKTIIKYVEENIEHIYSLYEYPEEIRKLIYTTNAVESVNSALRKVTRGKGTFVNGTSVMKVIYLRIRELEKKWSKGTANWKQIKIQLYEMYGERIRKYEKIKKDIEHLGEIG